MNEKTKNALAAADAKRQQWELAAMLGDSVSAAILKHELRVLEFQALCLMRRHML